MNISILTDKYDNRGNLTNGMKIAKSFRKLGHTVLFLNHKKLNMDYIRESELILAFGTLVYDKNYNQAMTIKNSKRKDAVFALWYFDLCHPMFSHSKWKYINLRKISPSLDWLFTTDHSYPWEKHVENYHHLMQGIDIDEFQSLPGNHNGRKYDVIFTGGFRGSFSDRGKLIDIIKRKYSMKIFGRNSKTRIYGTDFHREYQRAKTAFIPKPPKIINKRYWSNRLYLAAATGTPCVAGYVPGIEKHYIPNKEILTFNNVKEMLNQFDKLINDGDYRKRIGQAGRQRTYRDHTYLHRVMELIRTIYGGKDA